MPQVEVITVTADRLDEIIRFSVQAGVQAALKSMPAPPTEETYLSQADAARLLGVDARTIRNYEKAGRLKRVTIHGLPRFARSEVLKFKRQPGASR
jgi:hypothetical protein